MSDGIGQIHGRQVGALIDEYSPNGPMLHLTIDDNRAICGFLGRGLRPMHYNDLSPEMDDVCEKCADAVRVLQPESHTECGGGSDDG